MHALFTLMAREAGALALMGALGAGPASLLSDSFDRAARIALAPILGLCVGIAVATPAQFASINQIAWLLIPLALGSIAVAVLRGRGCARPVLGLRDLAQLLLVIAAVLGPTTALIAHHHSTGPAAYYYTDVDGYVYEADGLRTTSVSDAQHSWRHSPDHRYGDLVQGQWAFRADFHQQLDATPLEASFGWLSGLSAAEVFAPFLLIILLAGGLGAYATVRSAAKSATWAAVLAGALFGGPFFLRMYFDTYQAAICSMALLGPTAAIGIRALRGGSRGDLLATALLVGGYLSVYPVFVPLLGATVVLVLARLALSALRAGEPLRAPAMRVGRRLLAVVAGATAMMPVAFSRDVAYAGDVLHNTIPVPRTPTVLGADVIPGWVLQTREYWYLPSLGHGGTKQLIIAVLLPAIMLAVAGLAVVRIRPARVFVVLTAICSLAAIATYRSQHDCNYCVERNMLALAPMAALLVAGGIHVLYAHGTRATRAMACAVALLVVASVGQRARVELRRFDVQAFYFDGSTGHLVDDIPRDGGAVQIEGFWASASAQPEQALVYALVQSKHPRRASISLVSLDLNALQYMNFGVALPPGPEFQADYRYVLTRFSGVRSHREVIRRIAGVALTRRASPLDVTPVSGLSVPPARYNPSGRAWLMPSQPLRAWVVGDVPGKVTVTFRLRADPAAAAIVPFAAGVTSTREGDEIVVCAQASGRGPVRMVSVTSQFQPQYPPQPSGRYPPPTQATVALQPARGLELVSMAARRGSCEQAG